MARHKGEYFINQEEQNSSSRSSHGTASTTSFHSPVKKPATAWEQPDFEELDLCMEVTTYIYNWQ